MRVSYIAEGIQSRYQKHGVCVTDDLFETPGEICKAIQACPGIDIS